MTDSSLTEESPLRPPAQPSYILRGHVSPIHAVQFLPDNSALITGDADGWIVVWDISTKRPYAVWKAHTATILAIAVWDGNAVITHGKDGHLRVWQLDDPSFADARNQVLPVDNPTEHSAPWLRHSLEINTLNFCGFAACEDKNGLLVAVPAANPENVEIYQLPSEKRKYTVPGQKSVKTGMVMCLGLFYVSDMLCLAAGYESGHILVMKLDVEDTWERVYIHRTHSQPLLSLDMSPTKDCFFTSAADEIIAKHPISLQHSSNPIDILKTKHAGQQGVCVRSDGKIFATAGWDSRMRVYDTESLQELAVLKWHSEGCYAVSFANLEPAQTSNMLGDRNLVRQTQQRRAQRVKTMHWLAAGSKDGKVSLWNIY